jgi:hypothetical protein
LSIARHDAPMQIGIRNSDSMISIKAMPSIPSAHSSPAPMPSRSTNCHWAPAGS